MCVYSISRVIISFILYLIILFFLVIFRFRGELFGIGSNHTKYKSKPAPYSSSSSNGQNNSTTNSNGQQQLQYATSVHYASGSGMNGHNQTMAPGNFTYDEGY